MLELCGIAGSGECEWILLGAGLSHCCEFPFVFFHDSNFFLDLRDEVLLVRGYALRHLERHVV